MMWNVVARPAPRAALRALGPVALVLPLCTSAKHLTRVDVDTLVAKCEAAREAKIAPLREQAIAECIAQGNVAQGTITQGAGDADACRRFYHDLGERVGTRPRLFHDLPQCETSDEAQKHYRLYPP